MSGSAQVKRAPIQKENVHPAWFVPAGSPLVSPETAKILVSGNRFQILLHRVLGSTVDGPG